MKGKALLFLLGVEKRAKANTGADENNIYLPSLRHEAPLAMSAGHNFRCDHNPLTPHTLGVAVSILPCHLNGSEISQERIAVALHKLEEVEEARTFTSVKILNLLHNTLLIPLSSFPLIRAMEIVSMLGIAHDSD